MSGYQEDLIKLDHLGDLGMSEMIGLMRLHVQEVTRFTTLVSIRIKLSEKLVQQFSTDLQSYDIDPQPFLTRSNSSINTFSPAGIFLLKICAKVHDIGKPFFRSIYCLERSLTDEEYELQKLHANLTRIIVRSWASNTDYNFYHPELVILVADMATAHQEKFNGTGYPDSQSGTQISLVGRLLAITDAISAMVNPRPYQQPIHLHECLDRLQSAAGTHFDPDLLKPITHQLNSESRNPERISGQWTDTSAFSNDFMGFIRNINMHRPIQHAEDKKRREELEEVINTALKKEGENAIHS